MSAVDLAWIEDPPAGGNDADDLVILGPSLGTTAWVWQEAAEELRANRPGLRTLRFDLPGHGASPPAREPFSIADLADGVAAIADSIGAQTFHYGGLSLGGAIGIELGIAHSRRLSSLGIVSSDARIATPQIWEARAAQVRARGTASLVADTPSRWFARDFSSREPDTASRVLRELADCVDDESYGLCVDALRVFDRRSDTHLISTRVTVINGDQDPVTTTEQMQRLALEIPRAVFVDLSDASHLVALEKPFAVATSLL